jgi:hypothetical protein
VICAPTLSTRAEAGHQAANQGLGAGLAAAFFSAAKTLKKRDSTIL